MKFICFSGRSVKPFPLWRESTEPGWGGETSGKLVLESLEPEPSWYHHWWFRCFKGIQLDLWSMNAQGHNWQLAFFHPHPLLSCARGSGRGRLPCARRGTAVSHGSCAASGHQGSPRGTGPCWGRTATPQERGENVYNSSGFTWCNWSLVLALRIVCWLHSDVMGASYFSCFDNKSGAWLQRKSGLEHPVASQRQMCYQYRHLFLMIDLRHNSASKTKGMDALWIKIWHVSLHTRNKGERFMQMSWIVDGSHPGEIPPVFFKCNNNWH